MTRPRFWRWRIGDLTLPDGFGAAWGPFGLGWRYPVVDGRLVKHYSSWLRVGQFVIGWRVRP